MSQDKRKPGSRTLGLQNAIKRRRRPPVSTVFMSLRVRYCPVRFPRSPAAPKTGGRRRPGIRDVIARSTRWPSYVAHEPAKLHTATLRRPSRRSFLSYPLVR